MSLILFVVFCVTSHRVTCFRVAIILICGRQEFAAAPKIVDNRSATNSTDIGIITVYVL